MYATTIRNANLHKANYAEGMNPLSSLLRRAADTLDSINTRVEEHRQDADAPMIDTDAINDAVITLSASTISAVMDLFDAIPRPGCNHRESGSEQDSTVIEEEVDKVVGRMGLVQEEELAALRKRVIELEQKLASQ